MDGDAGGAVARYDNLSIEQPLHYADLCGAAFVRAHARAPLVLDGSVWSPRAMMEIARLQACDRIVLNLNRLGGFFLSLQAIAMCEAADIGGERRHQSVSAGRGHEGLPHRLGRQAPYPVDCEGHVSFLTLAPESPFRGGITLRDGQARFRDAAGPGG